MQLYANSNLAKGKPPFKLDDFLLDFEPPKKPPVMSAKRMRQNLLAAARAGGLTIGEGVHA